MSLMNTKPRWAPNAVATASGWTDPITKEVYVAIGNLEARLAAEHAKDVPVPVVEVKEPVIADYVAPVEVVESPVEKEVVMQEEVKEVAEVKVPAKRGRKPKQVNEVVEQPLQGKQLIGEVVEYPDVQILGE